MLDPKATDEQIAAFSIKSPYNLLGVMLRANPLAVYNVIQRVWPNEYKQIPANSVVRNDNTLHDMEKFLERKFKEVQYDPQKAAAFVNTFTANVHVLDDRRQLVWLYINKNQNRY